MKTGSLRVFNKFNNNFIIHLQYMPIFHFIWICETTAFISKILYLVEYELATEYLDVKMADVLIIQEKIQENPQAVTY